MSMTVSDVARLMDEKVKHRVPVTPAELGYWSQVLRSHIEREVDEAMVERACVAFHELPFCEFPLGFQISQRRDMKAALIAALGEK